MNKITQDIVITCMQKRSFAYKDIYADIIMG